MTPASALRAAELARAAELRASGKLGVGLALTGSDGWKGAGALAVLAIAGGVLLAFVGRTRRMRGRRIA